MFPFRVRDAIPVIIWSNRSWNELYLTTIDPEAEDQTYKT